MEFLTWIKYFKDVDRPVGDLAFDMLKDRDLPATSDYGVLHTYLTRKLSTEQLDLFEKLYGLYKADT